jgi:serine/threonine-protein kinase ATR
MAPIQAQAGGTPSKGTRGNAKAEAQLEATCSAQRLKNVSKLLAAIPRQALAGASFRCQAYARALLYFETHVREESGALNPAAETSGTFTDEDVTFLLEIYSGLDEPDGLSGLSRLRKSATLQDQILINEKAGNWAEALTCCEQALQMEPNSVMRHLGVLDCLLNMGHLQVLLSAKLNK